MNPIFLRVPVQDDKLQIAIIIARYRGQWVFSRRKGRSSWEFPGGHREEGETIEEAARRELWEETGIRYAQLQRVGNYQLGHNFGTLFFAEVEATGSVPKSSEIEEVLYSETLPEEFAYTNLPAFYEHVQYWLSLRSATGELWDVYNRDRQKTGRVHRRGEPLPPGDFHLVVHIWVRDKDGKYLLTKRSPNKGFPNLWEAPGGSALVGDDSLTAALREAREETGLTLLPENAVLAEARQWTDHFTDIWLFRQDFSLDDITLAEGETCDARKATAAEVLQLYNEGSFFPVDDLPQLLEKLESIQ